MNITTDILLAMSAAQIAALPAHTVIVAATIDLTAPALETAPVTPAHEELPTLKTLTRSAWKTLRVTRNGKVRKAFVGLTREQAHAAGLCEGFTLPTGEMKAHLAALKAAKA